MTFDKERNCAVMNDNQQQLQKLRNRMIRPEREGEYWTENEVATLTRKFCEGCGISDIAVALHRSEPAIMQEIEKLDLYGRKENPRRQRNARQSNCLCGRCGNDPASCPLRAQCEQGKECS